MGGCRGPRWVEADIDMESSTVANHVVALVKGVTTSQTIDMAVVLQVSPCPLPLLVPLPSHLHHYRHTLHSGGGFIAWARSTALSLLDFWPSVIAAAARHYLTRCHSFVPLC